MCLVVIYFNPTHILNFTRHCILNSQYYPFWRPSFSPILLFFLLGSFCFSLKNFLYYFFSCCLLVINSLSCLFEYTFILLKYAVPSNTFFYLTTIQLLKSEKKHCLVITMYPSETIQVLLIVPMMLWITTVYKITIFYVD